MEGCSVAAGFALGSKDGTGVTVGSPEGAEEGSNVGIAEGSNDGIALMAVFIACNGKRLSVRSKLI